MSKRPKKHGMCETRIYYIWEGVKGRCLNPKNKDYKNYGGRGITICESWKEFLNFYNWSMTNGYTEDLQIDRINVNRDYEPNNCRWADDITQHNNRRDNIMITFNGETKSITLWARQYNMSVYLFKKNILNKEYN